MPADYVSIKSALCCAPLMLPRIDDYAAELFSFDAAAFAYCC